MIREGGWDRRKEQGGIDDEGEERRKEGGGDGGGGEGGGGSGERLQLDEVECDGGIKEGICWGVVEEGKEWDGDSSMSVNRNV